MLCPDRKKQTEANRALDRDSLERTVSLVNHHCTARFPPLQGAWGRFTYHVLSHVKTDPGLPHLGWATIRCRLEG
ncbi:hypothetical protein OIU77_025378 [Salix suchowensis]|uniref:Uncharacterized protein n=1 Tax=Salix suchowensis TaxID=1278906 RepID=A0ABQ9BXR6_9ROSI|nr:hypothetical protein OIU77_025378 [Salix suchowensis]